MRRSYRFAALALTAALALSACSPAPEAGPETGWRDLVSHAAEQASAGDYAGADSTLSNIEQEVTTARDGQTIDAARADEILTAAAIVRADLAALVPPPAPPTPAPSESASETPGVGNDGSDSSDGSSDDDSNTGEGDSGNNGNGGNGNGGKKNKDDE